MYYYRRRGGVLHRSEDLQAAKRHLMMFIACCIMIAGLLLGILADVMIRVSLFTLLLVSLLIWIVFKARQHWFIRQELLR
jgi:hypothetical protein